MVDEGVGDAPPGAAGAMQAFAALVEESAVAMQRHVGKWRTVAVAVTVMAISAAANLDSLGPISVCVLWGAVGFICFIAWMSGGTEGPDGGQDEDDDEGGRPINIKMVAFRAAVLVVTVSTTTFIWSPCRICAHDLPASITEDFLADFDAETYGKSAMGRFTNVLSILVETEGSIVSKSCRDCQRTLVGFFSAKVLGSRRDIDSELASVGHGDATCPADNRDDRRFTLTTADNGEAEISMEVLQELDSWYANLTAESNSWRLKHIKKLLQILLFEPDDAQESLLLESLAKSYYCSPNSRTGPKPSEFVLSLHRPRFTGEGGRVEKAYFQPMNKSISELKSIIRGDVLANMTPAACFMARFVKLNVDTKPQLKKLNPTLVAPVASEADLKADDLSWLFPALCIATTDEDQDTTGEKSAQAVAIMDVFTKLPMRDPEPIWFGDRDDFLAFFRWENEASIQDEFYTPDWIWHVKRDRRDKGRVVGKLAEDDSIVANMVELMSKRYQLSPDRLRLVDPDSDQTLGERAIFGGGQKLLTAIKLPGDADYHYSWFSDPNDYETEGHRKFFNITAKPSEADLEIMGTVFWGRKVRLSSFRKRVVEVDYSSAARLESRFASSDPGAILYVDAQSFMPMGIWINEWRELVLPTAGRRWDHAKFRYRTTELFSLALRHVAEYHLGWGQIICMAIRQTLPQYHGLRLFLRPYCYGTPRINQASSQTLLRPGCLLHRASGLSVKGHGHAWGQIQKHLNMSMTLPDALRAKKLDSIPKLKKIMPLFTQGKRLWEAHHDFVEDFVRIVYPSDRALQEDSSLYRFWNHVDSIGRHLDPCVCSMNSKMFFEKDQWPAFETTKTCNELLDSSEFEEDQDIISRRSAWCQLDPVERNRALYSKLQDDCEKSDSCDEGLAYDFHHMRASMNLRPVTRKNVIDLVSMFIYEVTASHTLVSDNVPYMSDPGYGGVRIREEGRGGDLQVMTDAATYIFGNGISLITTIRSLPLLSDWGDGLAFWAEGKSLTPANEREALKKKVLALHLKYKSELVRLANSFLDSWEGTPINHRAGFLNPAFQLSSISV